MDASTPHLEGRKPLCFIAIIFLRDGKGQIVLIYLNDLLFHLPVAGHLVTPRSESAAMVNIEYLYYGAAKKLTREEKLQKKREAERQRYQKIKMTQKSINCKKKRKIFEKKEKGLIKLSIK
ncbi:hypothetical protein EVAR_64613_1 [Eumeta japonica]|uniref:Uncharacterized protein n=1 Tax=Eumeta variegata TaxID=151549 RepID=A0A4C1ZBP5_EUMVA|nr:hypothetical protein EVAR_64613_1 [Eumeta japonica]